MSELSKLTIAEARDRLRGGEITAVELTEACLAQVEAAGALNAFVHHTPEIARAQARRRMRG
jgi:aspartyl-tRNA(Asn)/glutamyl-tRNA(Gln) amidotransferase subunit A